MSLMSLLKRLRELEPVQNVKDWKDPRRKAEYISKVMEYKRYCGRSLVQGNKKMRDWCAFLEDYKPPSLPSTSSVLQLTTAASRVANQTQIDIPNDTGRFLLHTIAPGLHNASRFGGAGGATTTASLCYDDFNCDTPDLASLNHYLMGILALALCVVGVLANTLCVPSFNIHANRSSATFYMTGVAVCDTLVLILATLAIVMKNVPADFAAQQKVYKTFSGYLVPSAMPALELCELMSFWIVIALLVDRFLYLRYGFHSKAICSRSLCAKVMLSIFGLLALYTAPKCLQYKIVEYEIPAPMPAPAEAGERKLGATPASNEARYEVKVMLTQISSSDTYRNVMTHWLKVPVEMFIPLLILTGFTGYFLYKVVENRGAWYRQIAGKRNRQTPPAISNPLRSIVTERQVRQENVNILIALAVGLLVLVCKMPKFVAHVMMSETGHTSASFQIAVRFLDLLCAALKPALYLGVGDHLHRGIFGMFCSSCRAHEETAHEEIARVHLEMNHVSSMAAIAAAAAANNGGVTGGGPVPASPEECQPLNPNGDAAGAVEVQRRQTAGDVGNEDEPNAEQKADNVGPETAEAAC